MENSDPGKKPEPTIEEMEIRKSQVRVYISYGAAGFLFLGGSLFILFLIVKDKLPEALQLFQTILPVSAAIVSFWFAGRGNSPKQRDKE